jgi:hypothetical protein
VSRHPRRYRWCHAYADHAEVAVRLEALWLAWEEQWPQAGQRLAWLRDGLDAQLNVIMSEDGPLREYSGFERELVDAAALPDLAPGA